MVPAERSLVDLGKGKTTPLIGVLDAVVNKSQPSNHRGEKVLCKGRGEEAVITEGNRCGNCGKPRFHLPSCRRLGAARSRPW